jgi:pilus assembly protein Flp/PilA
MSIRTILRRMKSLSERGASAVEYGLLVSGIAVVIIAAIILFGGQVSDLFSKNCDSVSNYMDHTQCTQ